MNRVKAWSTSKDHIPLENGVFNLQTRELEPHRPDLWCNWFLPYPYDPGADCPTVKSWLLETLQDDQGMVEVLRAWINAVIKGRTDLQKYIELIGPGGTGKGTFLRLVKDLVGDQNTGVTELRELETNRFEGAAIYGKRLLQITDSSSFSGRVDKLKAITGQDPIRYEKKNKQQGPSFTPTCLVMVASNEMIQSADYTSGLERRRLTVLFENQPEKPDRLLQSKLKNELPGVLNWVLALSDQQVEQIISDPASVAPSAGKMKLKMLLETNPLIAWIHSNLVLDQKVETYIGLKKIWDGGYENTSSWLYANYLKWCDGQNNRPLSVKKFSPDLKDIFSSQLKLPVTKHSGRRGSYFYGIRIRTSHDILIPSPVTGKSIDKDVMDCDGLVMDSDTLKNLLNTSRSDGCDRCDDRYIVLKESLPKDSNQESQSHIKEVTKDYPHPSHSSHLFDIKEEQSITPPITNSSHVMDAEPKKKKRPSFLRKKKKSGKFVLPKDRQENRVH